MDKKALSLFIVAAALLIGVFGVVFSGCSPEENAGGERLAYVTMDVNPSIEFVVSEKGIVLAVNGRNDDGKVLIIGEDLIGKSIDEVMDRLFYLMVEMDYINEDKTNAVQLSIATESEGLERLVKETVDKEVKELKKYYDIAVETVKSVSRDVLVEAVLYCHPEMTKEEVNAMTSDQLMVIMKGDMLEKAEFALVAIEEQYYESKEMEFKFRYYDEMKSVIEGFDRLKVAAFNVTLGLVETSIETLRELEGELLEARVDADFIIINGVSVVGSAVELAMKAVDGVIVVLEDLFATLKSYEEEFTAEINADEILQNAEKAINDAKDGFFADYGARFEELLASAKEKVAARKAQLIENAA